MNSPDPESTSHTWTKRDLAIGLGLLLIALIAIMTQIGSRPAFAYNWENYAIWKGTPWLKAPDLSAFDITDGLMTDSGRSWIVLGPTWIAFKLADANVTSMRAATGAIAAFGVPLTWLVVRRLAPGIFAMPDWPAADRRTVTRAIHWTSILAALLLAGLASWLVYARTATNAGMTVVPALLTILLIDQVRRLERAWWAWLLALQGMLLLGAWAYAPVRFFYPLALVYFGIEFIFRRSKWREWLIVLIVTLVSLPVLLAFIDQDPGWNPADAINSYYNGRGEQVFALRDDPRGYPHFLRDADASSSPEELERQLIRQNAGDLARLLFDVDTKPALTDYWNQNGRLMPWFLSPLLVLGMLATVLRVFRSPESRLLNLMFWGFTLPLILTSKVHIGRLVVAMPLICIFAAIGLIGIAWGLTFRADRSETRKPLLNIVAPLLSLVLLVPLVRSTLEDLRSPIAPSWESRFAEMLEVESQQFANGVVWIGGGRGQLEVEEISLAAVSIQARGNYQFVNLAEGETPDPNDPRPALYFGAVTDLLANQETAAQICALPWVMHGHVDPLEGVTTVCESDQINRLP